MNDEEKTTGLTNSSKSISEVPLAPPPVPAKPGEGKTADDRKDVSGICPENSCAQGYVSFPKADINDKEALKEAAKKWLEAQSERSCVA